MQALWLLVVAHRFALSAILTLHAEEVPCVLAYAVVREVEIQCLVTGDAYRDVAT